MNLERDLRRALGREEPPDRFAERVLAEVSRDARHGLGRRAGAKGWIGLGMAASLVIAVGAAGVMSVMDTRDGRAHQRELARAERARRDVVVALRITSDKLYEIQVKLAAINERRGAQ